MNNKAKLTTREDYGFKSYKTLKNALYHQLRKLPETEPTHRFCWQVKNRNPGIHTPIVRLETRTQAQPVLVLAFERSMMSEQPFDHERLDAYRLSSVYGAFSYRKAKSLLEIIDRLPLNGCRPINRFR